ncbi:relaxase/mobilization nuclease domain-containing protein [Rhodopseudomonas sp. RCAM05734]|uniref:relaxase/mobilization nuclease domain-containing protein n=1 Tax=Rhodopseudomonas sp. RCAM05734 TaxID=3457549 RepID=UPI00404413B7
MILTTKRHGRTAGDIKRLLAHLSKQVKQTSRVVRIDGVALPDAADAMRYMELLRDASLATVACHHISISPRIHLTDDQRDEAVRRILAAMNALDHAYVLWQHSEKARTDEAVAEEHFHLVVSHIGPDGLALNDSMSFAKLEAAARTLEVDFGEKLTPSRLTKSVIKELRRIGRDDVAEMMVLPASSPASAMSSRTRAKAARQGVDLPLAQAAVRLAWLASDTPSAFRAALAEEGLEIAVGARPNVLMITRNGVEVGALDRIVREKRTAVAVRMKEGRHDKETREAPQRGRSDLFRGIGSTPVLREPSASTPTARGEPERRRPRPSRSNDGPPNHDRDDPGKARRDSQSSRDHVNETVVLIGIGRDDSFRKLRRFAESTACGSLRGNSQYRRALDRAAGTSISRMKIADLRAAASKVAAGSALSDNELMSLKEARMKSMKPVRQLDYKAKLLAEIAPHGLDVSGFIADIHMVKKPTRGNPVARLMMRDGGWCEIDTISGKAVRTWGPVGRAQVFAQAVADILGCEVTHLAKTVSMSADATALRVVEQSKDTIEKLTRWWAMRGYTAVAAPDGCWIDAGHSRILDTGDHLEFHGGLSDSAIAAALTKARDAWNGGVTLEGGWTQAEKDRLWIAAQRHGIEVGNCAPSSSIQATWQREQCAVVTKAKTISAARSEIVDAQDLIAAAKGDVEAARRLKGPLQAFVGLYLDDDQRAELAAKSVADVVPELSRLRTIGAVELDAYEATSGRKFSIPAPDDGKQQQRPEWTVVPR